MSQPEKVKFCLYPDIYRNKLASPSSTSTPNFDYLEVPDRAAQRQALFSSVLSYERLQREWAGPKLATIKSGPSFS